MKTGECTLRSLCTACIRPWQEVAAATDPEVPTASATCARPGEPLYAIYTNNCMQANACMQMGAYKQLHTNKWRQAHSCRQVDARIWASAFSNLSLNTTILHVCLGLILFRICFSVFGLPPFVCKLSLYLFLHPYFVHLFLFRFLFVSRFVFILLCLLYAFTFLLTSGSILIVLHVHLDLFVCVLLHMGLF